MRIEPPSVPTVGEIARRLNVPVHRINYLLRSRRLRPIGRAGNARIYSDDDVAYIATELRRIKEERVNR